MSTATPENSGQRITHSKLSAERYSKTSNDFDDLDTVNPSSFRFEDLFPDMDYNPAP